MISFPEFLASTPDEESLSSEARDTLLESMVSYLRAGGAITPGLWGQLSLEMQELFAQAGQVLREEQAVMVADAVCAQVAEIVKAALSRSIVEEGLKEALKP